MRRSGGLSQVDQQLEATLNATPTQRLAWLDEDVTRLALASGALEARREAAKSGI